SLALARIGRIAGSLVSRPRQGRTEKARAGGSGSRSIPAHARGVLALGIASGLVFFPLRARDEDLTEWAATAEEAMRLLDRGEYREAGARFARAEESLRSAR